MFAQHNQGDHLEGDEVVRVLVTGVQEGGQAMLESVERSLEWEELVSGDHVIFWVLVKITPLPHSRIAPSQALLRLSLLLQLLVVRGDLVPVSQVLHDVEQPLPHPPGEVHE